MLVSTLCVIALTHIIRSAPVSRLSILNHATVGQSESEVRMLQASKWHAFKVAYDYSHLTLSEDQLFMLQNIVVPQVTAVMTQISVKGFQMIPPFNASTTNCTFNATLISNYSEQQTNADLLIFFVNYNSSSGDLGYSIPCGLDYDTNRTIIGIVYLNMQILRFTTDFFETSFRLILKQHIHLMAMNSMLFPYMKAISKYIKTETSAWNDKTTVTRIATPQVVSAGQSYFNCPTFAGLLLEDESGYFYGRVFWEKLAVGNELMVADLPFRAPLSVFTLSFLNDTTWYLTSTSTAETLIWGYQKGCAFLASGCDKPFIEYCSKRNQNICTPDYMSKGQCVTSKYSNGCLIANWVNSGACNSLYNMALTAMNEKGGQQSRCLPISLNGAPNVGCYPIKCVANYLSFTIQGMSYVCGATAQEVIVQAGQLSVICPNVTEFCGIINNSMCPNDCSAVGVCKLTRQCSCHPFYQGDTCTNQYQCNSTLSGPVLSQPQCIAATTFNASTVMMPLFQTARKTAVLLTAAVLLVMF